MLKGFLKWFTRSMDGDGTAPAEAIFLRSLGLVYLILFIVGTTTTRPRPDTTGEGLAIALAMAVVVISAVATAPRMHISQRRTIIGLLGVTAASAVLAALQPKGIWQAGPYFVGIIAAMRLERLVGLATLGVSLATMVIVAAAGNHGGAAISVVLGSVPWYFVMRLMAGMRQQQQELKASKTAEALAAAEAERGRLSREMHDVLAHSLSALALQLESARLLARDRGTDPDVTRALDQAHHLAAGGLDEARRAIAAARGEELPGPERLPALAEAFAEQSGIPATCSVSGSPRELASDARLALYRTAQEALTNVRRHATPELVEIRLAYLPTATVLSVEDRGAPDAAPAALSSAGGGFGLSGMRERAELLGGQLTAEPTATGFLVRLSLPAEQTPAEKTPAAISQRP